MAVDRKESISGSRKLLVHVRGCRRWQPKFAQKVGEGERVSERGATKRSSVLQQKRTKFVRATADRSTASRAEEDRSCAEQILFLLSVWFLPLGLQINKLLHKV